MSNPNIFFREAGSGPTVICIHASASSSGQWRMLTETLSDRFRVVAMDLYGYGKSPAWPGERELQLEDEIALMAPILESVGQFHLIGHSYGGLVVLTLALMNPSRVASLTHYEPTCFFLLSANGSGSPARREILTVRDETRRHLEAGDYQSAAQHFIDYWVGPGAWSKTPEASRLAIANSMGKVRFEWPNAFDNPLSAVQISALTMPVLLLTGARSTVAARAVNRRLQALLPAAQVVEFPGLGHMGPVTHPEQVNEAITTYYDMLCHKSKV